MAMNEFHKTKVYFDGYELTKHFVVQNLQRPFAKKNIDLVTLPGRDGAIIGNTTYDPVEITMDLVILDESRGKRSDIMRELALLFNTDEPKRLHFSDEGEDPGLFYLAVANGGDIERFIGADRITGITFTCPEPAMYDGDVRVETIPYNSQSAASLEFDVAGNYPTSPVFTGTVTGNDQNNFGLLHYMRDDKGAILISEELLIPLRTGGETRITIDCTKRTVREGSVNTIPSLYSDWFTFLPGKHEVMFNYGSGDLEMTFYERWL